MQPQRRGVLVHGHLDEDGKVNGLKRKCRRKYEQHRREIDQVEENHSEARHEKDRMYDERRDGADAFDETLDNYEARALLFRLLHT